MIELCDGSRQTYFSASVRSEPIGLERGHDTGAALRIKWSMYSSLTAPPGLYGSKRGTVRRIANQCQDAGTL